MVDADATTVVVVTLEVYPSVIPSDVVALVSVVRIEVVLSLTGVIPKKF